MPIIFAELVRITGKWICEVVNIVCNFFIVMKTDYILPFTDLFPVSKICLYFANLST